MTDNQWDLIEGVLEECWPGQWTPRTGPSYRLMVGHYPAEAVVAALRKHAARRVPYRPSVGDIVGALEQDPSRLSWTEAWPIIERALAAGSLGRAVAVAASGGAMLRAFVEITYERLHTAPLYDPQYGPVEQERVRAQWAEFSERSEERQQHGRALEAGGRTEGGDLRKLAPLAALGTPLRALPGGAS